MGIKQFNNFRKILDEVMITCINKRIVLYGYGRTGQFLEWYAEYYHSIKIDYIVTDDWSSGNVPYTFPIFRESLFDFNYKDVNQSIVWLAVDKYDKKNVEFLEKHGYKENETFYDFKKLIYQDDILNMAIRKDAFSPKTGFRDVQFMEYLEYLYDMNFVSAVYTEDFENSMESAHSYCITTQREIFPILDKLRCQIKDADGIFDFGCGKGGAILSFLDYGFKRVGGVEYENKLYDILIDNYDKLEKDSQYEIELIHNDAGKVKNELDKYNYFYYFDPFEEVIFMSTIKNIIESYQRNQRHITLICINPTYHNLIIQEGFKCTNSFMTNTKQKVCNIYIYDDFS